MAESGQQLERAERSSAADSTPCQSGVARQQLNPRGQLLIGKNAPENRNIGTTRTGRSTRSVRSSRSWPRTRRAGREGQPDQHGNGNASSALHDRQRRTARRTARNAALAVTTRETRRAGGREDVASTQRGRHHGVVGALPRSRPSPGRSTRRSGHRRTCEHPRRDEHGVREPSRRRGVDEGAEPVAQRQQVEQRDDEARTACRARRPGTRPASADAGRLEALSIVSPTRVRPVSRRKTSSRVVRRTSVESGAARVVDAARLRRRRRCRAAAGPAAPRPAREASSGARRPRPLVARSAARRPHAWTAPDQLAGEPSAAIRPWSMTTRRSQSCSASSM